MATNTIKYFHHSGARACSESTRWRIQLKCFGARCWLRLCVSLCMSLCVCVCLSRNECPMKRIRMGCIDYETPAAVSDLALACIASSFRRSAPSWMFNYNCRLYGVVCHEYVWTRAKTRNVLISESEFVSSSVSLSLYLRFALNWWCWWGGLAAAHSKWLHLLVRFMRTAMNIHSDSMWLAG